MRNSRGTHKFPAYFAYARCLYKIRNFNGNSIQFYSTLNSKAKKARAIFIREIFEIIYKHALFLLLIHLAMTFFTRERCRVFLHFCNIVLSTCARCMQIIYCKRIPRYFSLLDGYAISFNSPTKFAGEKVGDAHRGYAIRWTRTVRIRRYIFTPSAIAFRRNFPYACFLSLFLFLLFLALQLAARK